MLCYVCIHDTVGCQTGLTISCIVYTNIQPVVKPVCRLTTGLISGCIVYTAGFTTQFDNRLYRVNGVSQL